MFRRFIEHILLLFSLFLDLVFTVQRILNIYYTKAKYKSRIKTSKLLSNFLKKVKIFKTTN